MLGNAGGAVRGSFTHEYRQLTPRIARPARPPLTAVDHVAAATCHDRSGDVSGVGGSNRRLGHRETRTNFTLNKTRRQYNCPYEDYQRKPKITKNNQK